MNQRVVAVDQNGSLLWQQRTQPQPYDTAVREWRRSHTVQWGAAEPVHTDTVLAKTMTLLRHAGLPYWMDAVSTFVAGL